MSSGACLDENQVVQLAEGRLAAAPAAALTLHLDACEVCRHLVSAAAQALAATASGAVEVDEPLRRGESFDRYVILEALGVGGMGRVYAAWDGKLDRRVALKFLHLAAADSSDEAAAAGGGEVLDPAIAVRREAQAMARLSHPNVVAVYDVGKRHGRVFVAMEFVDGVTLGEWLGAASRSWREILDRFLEAGRGLAAAHAAGLIHRDFKPHNVLVGRDGRVRVTDFGLARAVDGEASSRLSVELALIRPAETSFEATQRRAGTPGYMAPEQMEGGLLDGRSDLFAFCVALYEALYDRAPFPVADPVARLTAVREGRVEAPRRGGVPAWVRPILLRGLRYRADERWPDLPTLLEALGRDPARRRRLWLTVAGATLALVAAAATWRLRLDPAAACRAGAGHVATIWGADHRRRVTAAFAATGLPYAGDASSTVGETLDRFAAGWSRAYASACIAGARRAEPDAAAYLKMACLSQQLDEVRAKSELFLRADAKVVQNAAAMVAAIDEPERCARGAPSLLPPPAAAVRPQVEALRRQLAEAKALEEASRYEAGFAVARRAVAEATRCPYRPLLAEALYQLGLLEFSSGDFRHSLDSLLEAATVAEATRHDLISARAWVFLVFVASERGEVQRAEDFSRQAQAAIERLGGDERLAVRLLDFRGVLRFRAGRHEEALALEREALARSERLGRSDRETAWVQNDLGSVLHMLGRLEEAAQSFAQAAATKERALGRDHPDVAISLSNLGWTLTLIGRYDEAAAALARAQEIHRRSLPDDNALQAALVTNLGDLAAAQGRHQEAERHYRQAIVQFEKTVGGDPPSLPLPLTGLGRALLAQGRLEEAQAQLGRALRIQLAHPGDAVELADTRAVLARVLVAAGRDGARAEELVRQALDGFRSAGPRGRRGLDELAAWRARVGPIKGPPRTESGP